MKQTLTGAQYQGLMQQPAFVPTSTNAGTSISLPLTCLSPETFIGFLIAVMSRDAGGLSTKTMQCMQSAFNGIDLVRLMEMNSQTTSTPTGSDFAHLMGAFTGMALCLNDQQASRIGSPIGFPLSALRCLGQRLGESGVIQYETMAVELSRAAASGTPPSIQELQQMLQYEQALQACGLLPSTPGGPLPTPRPPATPTSAVPGS